MRFALRSLVRTPSFAAIAILTLAVGIGTNTTVFAIVDELAFRPARVTGDAHVYHVMVQDRVTHQLGYGVQIPDYEALSANRPDGLEAIAAYDTRAAVLQIPGRADHVSGWRVTGQYAAVFHVRAQLGRWINDDDNAEGELDPTRTYEGRTYPIVRGRLGADVLVISDRIWREWFDASPDVVVHGTMTFDGRSMRIVGVAPARFEPAIDVWTPFGSRRQWTREELDQGRTRQRPNPPNRPPADPRQPELSVMVRMAGGVSAVEVGQRMTAVVESRPSTLESPTGLILMIPREGDVRLVRTGYTILGFAALIFIAACANLANMVFARATEREGELAVRLSLGATRLGIAKLLFAETILICISGSIVGLLFAAGVLHLFTDAFPAFQVDYWKRITLDLSIDWRIAGYAAGAGLVAALVVGAGSLWRSSRVSLLSRLAAAGPAVVARTEGRTARTMLVAVQVTAAVLLLISTGMLLENSSRRLNRRILFDTSPLISATVELPDSYDESRGQHFQGQLLARVRGIEGVTSASLTDALPGGEMPVPSRGISAIVAETPPQGLSGAPMRLDGQWVHVSPGFFATIGLPVARGRDFLDTDEAGADPVALVSESTARRLWPGDDPLGKRIVCCGETYLRRVIGLVPDPTGSVDKPLALNVGEAMSDRFTDNSPGTFVFLPAAQHYRQTMLVVLRSNAPRAAIQPLRNAVAALDPAVPVFDAAPVDATQFAGSASERAVRLLAGALGAISLGIAVLGVYAIVSYFVSRRTREFALRLALGSTRRQIVKLVVDYALHIVLIGLLPGVLFASLGTQYFQAELRDLHPNGLMTWGVVPVLMLVVGVVAAYIPARRAARVDPYRALKELDKKTIGA